MKWATETQGTRGETDFFTLSAQFPLYFLPEDPCLQNVQSMLSVDRLWNLPEQKKNEKRRERERVTLLPPSCAVLQNDGIIIQKTCCLIFSLFYPGVPGTLSYYCNQNTWTAHTGYPLWRRERRKHKCSFCKVHLTLFLSRIMLNWCSCEKVHGRLWLRFSDE